LKVLFEILLKKFKHRTAYFLIISDREAEEERTQLQWASEVKGKDWIRIYLQK
jgi:hypothetical protein